MRLSWNEIRIRAAQFAQDWKDAGYEKGETQSFYNEFFDIFDVKRRTVARYEEHVQRLDNSRGFIDLFWPGVLLVEQKSAGVNLAAARKQAGTYFDALPERDRPRYQLLCDFQTFELLDRDEREEVSFALADLPQHVEKFGFILGVQKRTFRDQDPVNIEASERVGQLHDALAASGYTGHDLEQFLVRIVFCLFADDTGIFEPRDIFFDFLENRTQKDGSDARGMAHVHVVIIGLTKRDDAQREKRLFSYDHLKGEPHESRHAALSPYLFDASGLANPRIVVKESVRTLNGLSPLLSGSQPIDNGNYIFNTDQRAAFLMEEPDAEKFMHPYIGAREHIQGGGRWILALQDASPADLRAMPKVVERMRAVKAFRTKSKRKSTLALADYPAQYNVTVIPTTPFLVVPEVSSERREYVPIGWLEPPVIPSNLVRIIENASKPVFALLTSAMHVSWLHYIGGRLESRYRYSIGLVYNTFPLPPVPAERLQRLTPYADAVLAARASHPNATLADLYDPDLMPVNLRKAHQALDRAVDRLYRRSPFLFDRERVEHLLVLYEKMIAPLSAPKPKRRRRRS